LLDTDLYDSISGEMKIQWQKQEHMKMTCAGSRQKILTYFSSRSFIEKRAKGINAVH